MGRSEVRWISCWIYVLIWSVIHEEQCLLRNTVLSTSRPKSRSCLNFLITLKVRSFHHKKLSAFYKTFGIRISYVNLRPLLTHPLQVQFVSFLVAKKEDIIGNVCFDFLFLMYKYINRFFDSFGICVLIWLWCLEKELSSWYVRIGITNFKKIMSP